MKKTAKIFATLAAAAMMLAACSGSPAPADKEGAEPQTLTVFAAASLNKVFPQIVEEVFEPANEGVKVSFSFEGSSTLVDQLKNGAPADVFASADTRNMDKATDADLVEAPEPFALNTLTLIVPAGNPGGVTGLDDSLKSAKVIKCHAEVPCGNLTNKVLDEAGIDLTPVSEEQKVTDVRGKIESGEGDAGFVYMTDAIAAGDKVEIIPIDVKGVNEYPIAVVKDSKSPELARKFIEAVLSDEGQELLKQYGFARP